MWQTIDNSLYRKFEFKNFDAAFEFVEKVAQIARELNHHPKITNMYNVVELWLTSHDAGDTVTDKDQDFADRVDQISLIDNFKEVPVSAITKAKLFTDGGSRGNPGPSALGYVIYDMEDNVVKKSSSYLGVTTNNQAEYKGLLVGLEAALALGIKELEVYMDSLLVINQVQGIWKLKNAELVPHHTAIRKLIPQFEHVTLAHVPRAMNALADSMVNECLDAH